MKRRGNGVARAHAGAVALCLWAACAGKDMVSTKEQVEVVKHDSSVANVPALSGANLESTLLSYPRYDGGVERVSFATSDVLARLRTYVQSSTQRQREGDSPSVTYREVEGMPVVRSGSLAFDALFALAIAELQTASVTQIQDGSYNDGQPIPCECFETGAAWRYVWTRDVSYASHLGLAMLDPLRARNSLLFKLSGFRPEVSAPGLVAGSDDGLQIVQDTGSGGSWPVSTDRVSWAFGAEAVLQTLPAEERKAFAHTAFVALKNTLENDRLATFDLRDGLYTGEQSFLDWREQSYAAWIASDLSFMASSKSLSTNVAHFKALTLASKLAGEFDAAELGVKYAHWAAQLRASINAKFWLDDVGQYSSLTAGHFDGAPLHKYDWLGQSLAIITGVADAARTERILANYPHGPLGAPVFFPQQRGVAIYHNRAIWPFVTAYGLQAAILGKNVSVADEAYGTLLRSAALSLSNMENLEWLSGQPVLDDPAHPSLGGPVINSRRQLWSVAAYLGAVIQHVFGVSANESAVRVEPFITARLRRETLGAAHRVTLRGLHLGGKLLDVNVTLPPATEEDGYYRVAAVYLNGRQAAATIFWKQLDAHNTIEVSLGQVVHGSQAIKRVSAGPLAVSDAVYSPYEPEIRHIERTASGHVALLLADAYNDAATTRYRLYRDGKPIAENLAVGTWVDATAAAGGHCYALEAISVVSGYRSQHSKPVCADGGIEIAASDPRMRTDVSLSRAHDADSAPYFSDWGQPEDVLRVQDIALPAGRFHVQVKYRNANHAVDTGITNCVKQLSILDAAGKLVARRVVQMPHAQTADGAGPRYSTPADVALEAGHYTLELRDFYNMSYLQSNGSYTAAGGKGGPVNRADIYGVRILAAH